MSITVSQATAQTTTYSYKGNAFTQASGVYTTSDSISGSITLSSPLAGNLQNATISALISTFAFSDGVYAWSPADSRVNTAVFSTDQNGNITSWAFVLVGTVAPLVDCGGNCFGLLQTTNDLSTVNGISGNDLTGNFAQGNASNGFPNGPADPGTWTSSVQSQPFQCSANSGVAPADRFEGMAEPTGDLVVSCTGGVPTALGALIPQLDIQVSLNTALTSRLLTTGASANAFSEALLLLNEPPAGGQVACTNPSAGCPAFSGASNNPNVFQGIQTGVNVVTFFGVPISPPGNNAFFTIRITNIRANANALGVAGPNATPTAIVETISTGPTPLPISNPSVTVAFIQQGVSGSLSGAPSFSQCSSQNQALADDPTQSGGAQFNITLSENFATAFKQRNVATTPSAPYALANQNNLTVGSYLTESIFDNLAFPSLPGDNLMQAGLASQGTRLLVNFQNIPAGVSLFTQVSPAVSGSDVLRLTNTDVNGAGPFSQVSGNLSGLAPIPLVSGGGIAVFEDLQSDPNTFATVTIPIYVAYDSTSGLPALGSGTVSANLAPVSAVTTADPTAPAPRFAVGADLTGKTAFTINACACASNMSAPITVTRGGFFYNFATRQFQQNVTIKNTGQNSIAGPISLALDSLSANTTLVNAGGVTSCAAPSGSPYLAVNVGTALAPGASASLVLQFSRTGAGGVTYNTRILAGSGGR